MKNEFALALVKARETSGLTQRDLAYLTGTAPSVISSVGNGQRTPSIQLAAILTILFNRRFDTLFADLVETIRAEIGTRLQTFCEDVGVVEPNSMRGATLRN